MDVTQERVERVLVRRLQVSRGLFGRFWAEVEQQATVEDDELLGVLLTCRWLAGPDATWGAPVAHSPFRRRQVPPEPEEIEAEYAAAVAYAAGKHREDGGATQRAVGVAKTLEWLWRGSWPAPPVEIPGYVAQRERALICMEHGAKTAH